MDINSIYSKYCRGEGVSEETLFKHLTERFRLFAELKVRDRADAEEIVQKTLVVIYAKYKDMTFTTSFSAWAHQILMYEILKYYRAQSYHDGLFTRSDQERDGADHWAPDPTLKRQLLDCLKKICRVNARYARVLNLHYHGYEVDDICRRLKTSSGNLYVILYRARSMLKMCLEKGDV